MSSYKQQVMGCPTTWELVIGLKALHYKNSACYEIFKWPWTWMYSIA